MFAGKENFYSICNAIITTSPTSTICIKYWLKTVDDSQKRSAEFFLKLFSFYEKTPQLLGQKRTSTVVLTQQLWHLISPTSNLSGGKNSNEKNFTFHFVSLVWFEKTAALYFPRKKNISRKELVWSLDSLGIFLRAFDQDNKTYCTTWSQKSFCIHKIRR